MRLASDDDMMKVGKVGVDKGVHISAADHLKNDFEVLM